MLDRSRLKIGTKGFLEIVILWKVRLKVGFLDSDLKRKLKACFD